MKVSDITVKTFRTYAARWDVGHAQPLPKLWLMGVWWLSLAGRSKMDWFS